MTIFFFKFWKFWFHFGKFRAVSPTFLSKITRQLSLLSCSRCRHVQVPCACATEGLVANAPTRTVPDLALRTRKASRHSRSWNRPFDVGHQEPNSVYHWTRSKTLVKPSLAPKFQLPDRVNALLSHCWWHIGKVANIDQPPRKFGDICPQCWSDAWFAHLGNANPLGEAWRTQAMRQTPDVIRLTSLPGFLSKADRVPIRLEVALVDQRCTWAARTTPDARSTAPVKPRAIIKSPFGCHWKIYPMPWDAIMKQTNSNRN